MTDRRASSDEIVTYTDRIEFFCAQIRRVVNDNRPIIGPICTHDASGAQAVTGIPCCDEPPSRDATGES